MIYALNAIPEEWRERILKSLKAGIGRFGWSYDRRQNLKSEEEYYDKGKCRFLLELVPDDFVIYINMPDYGKCTLARVSGPYFFQEPMDDDFNHCFRVDATSIRTFYRNDNIVPPPISARLKLQNRYWRIYAEEDFGLLLKRLEGASDIQNEAIRTIDDNIEYFLDSASEEFKSLAEKICMAHPNFDLEKLMCKVFENSSRYIHAKHMRGRADKGADIILTGCELPTEELQRICLVQVKSYSGVMDTENAIDSLKKAFDFYADAHCGLIVSTATEITENFKSKLNEFAAEQGKPVGLLYGEKLSRFIVENLPK
ncbi:MAG: restriction endonuclease [Clostridiales Family XIII bacterium]|jgi:hypothetical protein|nr:restriction endonuclease [Clostridiales Family XIII bacterium]